MNEFGEDLKEQFDIIAKALLTAGIPGGSVFYVLENSGANEIVTYILTITLMGVILLFIIAHILIKRMGEMRDGS